MASNALQKANAAAKARLAAKATSHTAVAVRRAKVAELWGKHATVEQMWTEVNAYMVSQGYPAVSRGTLADDREIVGRDFANTISEAKDVRAREHAARLNMLYNRHFQHLEKAEETGGSVAPIVNNLRLIEVDSGKFDGSYSEKHEHEGQMNFTLGVQRALAVNPEGERKVIPLIHDRGDGALLAAPETPTRSDG